MWLKLALVLPAMLLATLPAYAAKLIKPSAYINPKLSPQEHPVRQVLLLPAQVQLTKSGVKGDEGMPKESEQVAARIPAVLTKTLAGRKVQVLPEAFAEETLHKDDELQSALLRLQRRYDSVGTQLHARPKDVRKSRFSLGDEVATLRPAATADALVFIRARGSLQTGGKSALGLMMSASHSSIRITICFVDAASGDVLAFLEMDNLGDVLADNGGSLGKTLTKLLKNVPFTAK